MTPTSDTGVDDRAESEAKPSRQMRGYELPSTRRTVIPIPQLCWYIPILGTIIPDLGAAATVVASYPARRGPASILHPQLVSQAAGLPPLDLAASL